MKLATVRVDLNVILVRAREIRTSLNTDLDAIDDRVAESGPYRLDGAVNEELRQLLAGAKHEFDAIVEAIRRLQFNLDRMADVKGRYDGAQLVHPVED